MVPRRAEGIFCHHPAFAEQNKVDVGCSSLARGRGQHSEDGWIRVIKQDRTNWTERLKVIFAGGIVAVPSNDIQWRVPNFGFMKLPALFNGYSGWNLTILKGCYWCFEVAWIGKAIGPNGSPIWQIEFLPIVFANKPTRRAFQNFDA